MKPTFSIIIIWSAVVALLFINALAGAQDKAIFREAQAYMPATVTVRATMPDTARICVEPSDGTLMNCRTIKDLRIWAQERALK